MTPNDTDRDPVDVLAEEFADRLRRGERPSVDAYAAAHPDLAERLRELLPAVAQMEQLKRFRKAAPTPARKGFPTRLGDFRLVREVGRGGMGVVFEAVQESLGRRVALKVLATQSQLDAERRERFVREAKAAARLHHTNIVPVFGVGEQDGLPYYVMQLIPGRGLYGVIVRWREGTSRETGTASPDTPETAVLVGGNRRPRRPPRPAATGADTWVGDAPEANDWAFIAGVGVQAAEALHHAHENGVLHRDVKPGNLLLDDRGQVWVTDFGLAKLVDHQGITETGSILGTLQYMAPECLHGEADARGDVYGLGASLYELLTLNPPIPDGPPARMMKHLADEDPVPPREVNPDIPRDLETIVLTAMAREPDRRYATADELAADLRAFLEDRPIRARRESWAARGVRWCRRNPAVALLSSITAAAVLLTAVVGWVGYVRTKKAFVSEGVKRQEAEEASAKLEANLRLSLGAFEKVFEAAGGDDFRPGQRGGEHRGGPEAQATRDAADKAAMLEAVLTFYDKFAEQNATNPRLRFEAAKAYRRVAEVHRWLGRDEKAGAAFRRAAGLLDGLDHEYPNDDEVRYELMMAYANAPVAAGGAEAQLLRAVEYGRRFVEPPQRWGVGTVHLKLGWAREQGRDKAGAATAYRRAIELYSPEAISRPMPPNIVVERATARQRVATLLAEERKYTEARTVLETAANELRQLGHEPPPAGHLSRDPLVATLEQLAGVLDQLGDTSAAQDVRYEASWMKNSRPGDGPPNGPPPKGPNGSPPPKGPNGGPPPKGPRDPFGGPFRGQGPPPPPPPKW